MRDNNGSGSPLVNKLIALYMANIDEAKRLDVIETFIDAAAEDHVSDKAKNRIAIALDFYAAKNELSDEDYDEIDAFYENTVDKNAIQMPSSEKEAITLLSVVSQDKKFLHLEAYFKYLSSDIFMRVMPYYIGETLILHEEKVISRVQYHTLWKVINTHHYKTEIQSYFSETHDLQIDNFSAASFFKDLQSNITLRDNIATDWLIFMQDHSKLSEDELMDRVFHLMSSEE